MASYKALVLPFASCQYHYRETELKRDAIIQNDNILSVYDEGDRQKKELSCSSVSNQNSKQFEFRIT